MKLITAAAALLMFAAPAAAQHEAHGAGGQLPAGWQGRVDRANQNIAEVRVMSMASGLHVVTGPHVILWQPQRTASGTYRATATFTQAKHRNGWRDSGCWSAGATSTPKTRITSTSSPATTVHT